MPVADTYRTGVFTYDYAPAIGGGGRHVAEVCKRLSDVVVFSGQANELPDHVPVFAGRRHGFFKQLLMSLWLNLRVRAMARRFSLQKINVHTGPGGLFLLRKTSVGVIATAHHTYAQQARLMPSQRWKRLFEPLERRTLRLAEHVVCVSEDTRRAVVDHYGIDAAKTIVIQNGIDAKAFAPVSNTTTPEPKTPKQLLFLSRLEARKGIEFLLRSMRQIITADPEVRLLIGGRGSLRPRLERFVEAHGLAEHVEFLGFVPDDELPTRYRQACAVVVPSVFEGFGIPVVEAMACGTPVVGTDVDGIRTLIEHDRTGLLVPYGDETALTNAVLRVCRGEFVVPPTLAEHTRREFDWDRIAASYATLFE